MPMGMDIIYVRSSVENNIASVSHRRSPMTAFTEVSNANAGPKSKRVMIPQIQLKYRT